jgi:hypothetical protein
MRPIREGFISLGEARKNAHPFNTVNFHRLRQAFFSAERRVRRSSIGGWGDVLSNRIERSASNPKDAASVFGYDYTGQQISPTRRSRGDASASRH